MNADLASITCIQALASKSSRSIIARIIVTQLYSDLSSGKTGKLVRPNLGGSKELPYPRRLATNRGNEPDGREKPPAKGEEMWLQLGKPGD